MATLPKGVENLHSNCHPPAPAKRAKGSEGRTAYETIPQGIEFGNLYRTTLSSALNIIHGGVSMVPKIIAIWNNREIFANNFGWQMNGI